jgi:outer membrane protein assembly factor BamB
VTRAVDPTWPHRPAVRLALSLLLASTLALSGCSWFHSHKKKDDKKAEDKPAVLVPFANHFEVQRVWDVKVSGEKPKLRLGLTVAVDGQQAFVASHKGEIEALDVNTGKRLWKRGLKAPLSAGPAAKDGLVLLGTSKGEVIAVNENDGSVRWRVNIDAEILSAPAISPDLIVVRTVDGKLRGLASRDGTETWVADQQVPRLSLRGTSAPVLSGDLAICGFDNGRVMAVNRINGTTVWDTAVGQSHGSSELSRLIDVDAPVVTEGGDLFTVAYQGRVAHMRRDTGEVLWTRDISSYRGLAVDADSVYISTADGGVTRFDRQNGTEQWSQKALVRRQLTAPVVYGGYVVVADAGGVIHWLDPSNGDFVARALVNKSNARKPVISKGIAVKLRVSAEPVVANGLLLVFTDSGTLSAFRAPSR